MHAITAQYKHIRYAHASWSRSVNQSSHERRALELRIWSPSTWISPYWETLGIEKTYKSDRCPRPTHSPPRVFVIIVSVRANPWPRDTIRVRAIQHQQRLNNTTNNTTTNCHTLRWRTIQHQQRLNNTTTNNTNNNTPNYQQHHLQQIRLNNHGRHYRIAATCWKR